MTAHPPTTGEETQMANTYRIGLLTDEDAREIVKEQLEPLMSKLIRRAHKRGAKGQDAWAEHLIEDCLLFDAAYQLREKFKELVEATVSEAWHVSFGYSAVYHVPNCIVIRLK